MVVETTEKLSGTHVNKVNLNEKKDSHDDTTERRAGAAPPYVELSSHFVSLESAVEACGNGDASICRRPGCLSSKRMPLSQCNRQT